MRYRYRQTAFLLWSWTTLVTSELTVIKLPADLKDARGPIDSSFPGFAFEQASFYDYAFERGKPNTFSQNLIKSVLHRTGGTPLLRVGGTSGDHAIYNKDQEDAVSCSSTVCGPMMSQDQQLSVGPSYFDAFKNFPGAKFEFMVPFERQNLANTLEWTAAGLKAIGKKALYALEIGNEPDFYNPFVLKDYLANWQKFLDAMLKQHPNLHKKRIFQALDIASREKPLATEDAFDQGLQQDEKHIKQVAYHYYQGMAPESYDELKQWILHTNTTERLSVHEDNIKYLKANQKHIGYVLSEVADNLGGGNGVLAYRNSLATAIWAIDFQLHAMTIGVDRVNFQQIYKPGFCMWEPTASEHWGVPKPMVRPNYYAQPFVADFIGKGGKTTVVSILQDCPHLAAYAAYTKGKLARIALINVNLWKEGDGERGQADFDLQDLPIKRGKATLSHLNSPHGALAETDLTWKGLEWTFDSGGKEKKVKDDSEKLDFEDCRLSVSVDDASAVMIEF
ncbi:Hypothetical predicted protein [Lecanosticta acicola]|uniref:Beta-glucuronidase C-terminal domain-containing protein n=1 Tax=Lecanosticta acicola TaxID=111012 RepID=A0AAI8Z9Q6_9PEZI|nr:Hypothetical predicted protein [Lecanosticta acicola]